VSPASTGKVVSLTDWDKSRRPGGSRELLSRCRDMLVGAMVGPLPKFLDKVAIDLFDAADVSDDRDARNQYMDAREALKRGRETMLDVFERVLREDFARRLAGGGTPVAKARPQTLELSLVDDATLDQEIAVGKLGASLRASCEEELFALDRRVSVMLDLPDLQPADNPFGPDVVGTAIGAAFDAVAIGPKAKLAAFRSLEAQIGKALKTCYREIDQSLIDRGLLPDVHQGASRSAKKTFEPGKGHADDAIDAEDLFAGLQRLMAQRAAGPAGARPGPNANVRPGPGMPPGVGPPLGTTQGLTPQQLLATTQGLTAQQLMGVTQAMSVSQALAAQQAMTQSQALATTQAIGWLTGLQQGNGELYSRLGVGVDPTAVASGRINILREIKTSEVGQSVGDVEGLTIDIVAMVFDYVFDDRRIPDAIKAMIGRLQIPVLKIAVLDKTFFSKRTHPVRRLLDALAAASIGWAGTADENDPLYKQIHTVVHRILTEFETDIALFSQLLEDFEKFLLENDKATQDRAERAEALVRDRESLESARVVARYEVERRVREEPLPLPVTQFLIMYWREHLSRSYVAGGENGEAYREALAVMDELVWSCAPKNTAEDKKRLVTLIPVLLRRLQQGMDAMRVPASDRQSFLGALVDCHTQAVKLGPKAPKPEPVDTAGEVARAAELELDRPAADADVLDLILENVVDQQSGQSAQIERRVVSRAGVNVDEVRLRPTKASAARKASDDQYDDMVARLERGMWIEFRPNDHEPGVRAKLTWISPRRTVFLFSNQHGVQATTFAPDALALELRLGRAEVISDAPLFDSAVRSILDDLGSEVEPAT
jgi:Protein of unknown function (DUF1631)